MLLCQGTDLSHLKVAEKKLFCVFILFMVQIDGRMHSPRMAVLQI